MKALKYIALILVLFLLAGIVTAATNNHKVVPTQKPTPVKTVAPVHTTIPTTVPTVVPTQAPTVIPTQDQLPPVVVPVYDELVYQNSTYTIVVNRTGYILSSVPISAHRDDVVIQSAIDNLLSTGGELDIARGTYLLSTIRSTNRVLQIEDENNLTIRGAGQGSTILKMALTSPFVIGDFIHFGGCSNLEISGITFDQDRQNPNHTDNGIIGTSVNVAVGPSSAHPSISNIHFYDCAFINSVQSGVSVEGQTSAPYTTAKDVVIRDCFVNNSGEHAFYITHTQNSVIDACRVTNWAKGKNRGYGTRTEDNLNLIVENSYFSPNEDGLGHPSGQGASGWMTAASTTPNRMTIQNSVMNFTDASEHSVIGHGINTYNDSILTVINCDFPGSLYNQIWTPNENGQTIITRILDSRFKTSPYRSDGSPSLYENNAGYVTTNDGLAASVSDNGTILHGMSITPVWCVVSATIANQTATANNTLFTKNVFTVAIKKNTDGSPGMPQNISWRCGV